jgi:predicted GIY-YIG superfamily endonuclease
MADETIIATGASGSKYKFYVYPWGTNLKALGGVYMVLRKTSQNGNHTVLYIGQTGDLSERFDNHHKKSCFDRNQKTHIAAMLESSEKKRLRIEEDLIKNYNPICND